jgi:hypothetical protein
MAKNEPDPMDVERVLEALNRALALQQRSVLQFTMDAASMFGLEYQAVGGELWLFARAELEHLIMRKQNQVDWLRRARRAPG